MPEETRITPRCPVRTTMELVGGKWKLLLLYQLSDGPLRLSQLKKQLPDISDKVLVQELKQLCISGLVTKPEEEKTAGYALTKKGRHALPLVAAMHRFAAAYLDT